MTILEWNRPELATCPSPQTFRRLIVSVWCTRYLRHARFALPTHFHQQQAATDLIPRRLAPLHPARSKHRGEFATARLRKLTKS